MRNTSKPSRSHLCGWFFNIKKNQTWISWQLSLSYWESRSCKLIVLETVVMKVFDMLLLI
jgi:hypothetical protein